VKNTTGHSIGAVVEWSPTGASSYEPFSKRRHTGATISDLGLSLNGHTTMLAVSRRTVFVKPTHVPNAGEAEIRQVLQMRLGQLFPVAADDLAYDMWLTGKVSSEGRVAIVCGIRAETLKALNAQAAEAGIRTSRVVPAGLGSALLARSLGQKDCTVVEETGEGLAIDIVVGGELRWSRVVPLGSSADIEAEIERTHVMAGLPFVEVVAAGGLTYPGAVVKTDQSTLEMLASTQAQSVDVHLELPEAVAKRRARKESQKMRWAVIAAAAACILWAKLGLDYSQAARLAATATAASNKTLNAAKSKESASQVQRDDAKNLNLLLTRAYEPAQKFTDLLSIVEDDVPSNAWIGGLTLQRGKPFVLHGTSMDGEAVAGLLQKFSTNDRFRDAKLVFETNAVIETTPVVQFSMSMHVIGNLPLFDSDKDKKKQ